MKIDIFTLCDNAQEYNGKLVIIGTINSIVAEQFPIVQPELALVARVIFDTSEKGVHTIASYIKKKGEDFYVIQSDRTIVDISETIGNDAVVNVVVKGNNVMFPTPGVYTASITIDDRIWESDIYVRQID